MTDFTYLTTPEKDSSSFYRPHWRDQPFTFGELIGSGDYGSVYRARWGDRPCAAKTFFLRAQELRAADIQQETANMQKLRHDNIIRFHGAYEQGDNVYFIMDLAERGSLADVLQSPRSPLRGKWPIKARIAHEIARGLEYLHQEGVLHRDLKSTTVLLTKNMEVKLCDYGFPKVKDASIAKSSSTAKAATTKGARRWMAPELLGANAQFSTQSDVYALGMVMWEIAANCTIPFKEHELDETVARLVLEGQREKLPEGTPSTYRTFVERCWKHDPKERPEARSVVLIKFEDVKKDGEVPPVVEKNAVQKDVVKKDALEKDAVSKDTVGKDAVERDAVNKDSVNKDTVEKDAAKKDAVKKDSVEKDAVEKRAIDLMAGDNDGNVDNQTDDEAEAETHTPSIGSPGSSAGSHSKDGTIAEDDDAVADSKVTTIPDEILLLAGKAENNDIEAQLALAQKYEHGEGGVVKSDTTAFFWYLRAAKQGHAAAQFTVAELYAKGRGGSLPSTTTSPEEEAAMWYRKAADQGHAGAQLSMAELHMHGRGGVARDDAKAFAWCRKAALQGNMEAQSQLGNFYRMGVGISMSNAEAAAWYLKAAQQGSSTSQYQLGLMYEEGKRGIPKNYRKAAEWYRQAAEHGHTQAQARLALLEQNPKRVKFFRKWLK
ncbi:hypothetical protein BGZ73_006467 [Actinomortierella ambigua]|nr:hypothetical protein BGZ73_006467 [Actinomortierella ambigua]